MPSNVSVAGEIDPCLLFFRLDLQQNDVFRIAESAMIVRRSSSR